MNLKKPEYSPVEGKTYTLFGRSDDTSGFYRTLKSVADTVVEMAGDIESTVKLLNKYSPKKRYLSGILKKGKNDLLIERIVRLTDRAFSEYTGKVADHLDKLSLTKVWDRRLATTREQYHLYMLEIELTNRQYGQAFRNAGRKIALMPYCLQDFSVNCQADSAGFDYQCRHCSGRCFQNHASRILRDHNIEPYIWMEGDFRKLSKTTGREMIKLGVLGIACVPELLWGMRNCRKYNIPVVGLPLNANRCIRWFGAFHPNSIDLDELERLAGS